MLIHCMSIILFTLWYFFYHIYDEVKHQCIWLRYYGLSSKETALPSDITITNDNDTSITSKHTQHVQMVMMKRWYCEHWHITWEDEIEWGDFTLRKALILNMTNFTWVEYLHAENIAMQLTTTVNKEIQYKHCLGLYSFNIIDIVRCRLYI